MLLLLVAFAGGVLTILSPCVLPVLPVLLSGSVGGLGRPLGIVAGFTGSFVLLTLFLSTLVNTLGLSADTLRWGATVLLLGFGLTLALPALHDLFERLTAPLASRQTSRRKGFVGGVLVGITLGVIWTPCVGPILASVTTLALSGKVTALAAAVTLAYTLGVALPMLLVMLAGRKVLYRPALLNRVGRIQQVFGVVLALFAVSMVFGVDRRVQTALTDHLPWLGQLTFLEDQDAVQKQVEHSLQ